MAQSYLMLLSNIFLSTVSPVGEVVMQDYWMTFFIYNHSMWQVKGSKD